MCLRLKYARLTIMIIAALLVYLQRRGRRDRDRMVVRFITTCAINPFHHQSRVFEPRSWRTPRYNIM